MAGHLLSKIVVMVSPFSPFLRGGGGGGGIISNFTSFFFGPSAPVFPDILLYSEH